MPSILVVDDEPKLREALRLLLSHHGHTVTTVEDGASAIAHVQRSDVDLALLDVALPDTDGLTLHKRIRQIKPDLPCVFITAFGSIRSAVEAIRAGGFDYLTKPFDNDDLLHAVARALEHAGLRRQVSELKQELASRVAFPEIIGTSRAIADVVNRLSKVAQSDATVLVLGESGTGKELAARSVHRRSRRAGGPFMPINCAAIPTSLAEAELFGYERGAFTDARESRAGKFEQANGGTVFLDEVGELSLEVQAKLLRTLQEREVWRLGGRRGVVLDVRVVAATNRDLLASCKEGRFREDLYWRLSQFPVTMPPLRQRMEDLPLLATFLLERVAKEHGARTLALADDAMTRLQASRWPGNVRELENALRYAAIVADGDFIRAADLPDAAPLRDQSGGAGRDVSSLAEAVARATDRVERNMISVALSETRGNRTAAAELLQISRRTLFDKLKRFRLVEQGASDDGHD